MTNSMRSFSAQFIHDADHRKVRMPDEPLSIQDGPSDMNGDLRLTSPPPLIPPPSEAPPSFFILDVLNALDVLDGLMALCFVVCLSPHK